jgi:hypothetical protein
MVRHELLLPHDLRFIPIADTFRVFDGQILSIRPYDDPRTVIEGMQQGKAQQR